MMVLLLKQMHLQNEVAVDLALRVGWMRRDREMRVRRASRGGDDSGEVGRRRRIVMSSLLERETRLSSVGRCTVPGEIGSVKP
jgi:hypothetical protein